MTRLRIPILVLGVLLLPVLDGWAESRVVTTTLARDGELLSLVQGTYGELFPAGSATTADTTVLALQRTSPDGQQALEVVPATLSQYRLESPELVFESDSGVAYVFWQSWSSPIHSRFLVSFLDTGTWSDTIEVSGPIFALRTSPSFTVTRDSYADLHSASEQGMKQVARTVLHVLWSEEGDGGRWDTLYTPLVLIDGQYIGSHPLVNLNDLVSEGSGTAGSGSLQMAPVLRTRGSANLVVAGFLDSHTGDLATVEIRFAAGELTLLGDVVEAEVAASAEASTGTGETDQAAIIDSVRDRLQTYGANVKGEVLDPLVSNLEEFLRERIEHGEEISAIAGKARPQIVDFGFRLTDGEILRIASPARPQIVDFGVRSEGPVQVDHRFDVRLSVVSRRSLPTSLPVQDPEILVSRSGQKQILAWHSDGAVVYQESQKSSSKGWGAVQRIRLDSSLDFAAAIAILQQRVDQQ